jgi:hypothetical protein
MIMVPRQAETPFLEALAALLTPVRRRRHRQVLEGEDMVEAPRYEISERLHLVVTEQQTDGARASMIVETVDRLLRVVELRHVTGRTQGIEA